MAVLVVVVAVEEVVMEKSAADAMDDNSPLQHLRWWNYRGLVKYIWPRLPGSWRLMTVKEGGLILVVKCTSVYLPTVDAPPPGQPGRNDGRQTHGQHVQVSEQAGRSWM